MFHPSSKAATETRTYGSSQIAKSLGNRMRRGSPSSQGSNQNWVPDPLPTEERKPSLISSFMALIYFHNWDPTEREQAKRG